MNQDRTALKLCAECGKPAKYVRKDADGTPFRYLCGKCTGVHRRIASSYRSSKWTTEYHEGCIDGIVELSDVEKAESLVNYTNEKDAQQRAEQARREEARKASELWALKHDPETLRENLNRRMHERNKTPEYAGISVHSHDHYGVSLEIRNWSSVKSVAQVQELIRLLTAAIPELEDGLAKWDAQYAEKIAKADAALAAYEAEQAVVA
jgi:hypothetical protein